MSRYKWPDRYPFVGGLASEHFEDHTFSTLVRHDGRLPELHNKYPESWQRRDIHRTPKSKSGLYTMQRTAKEARNVAWLHAAIAELTGQRVYLITHTSSPNWLGPRRAVGMKRNAMHVRRESFRLFLDRLRKMPGYRGHYWTTEIHPGEGENAGTIHHHIAARFSGFWNYRNDIQRWSARYCGSNNGLDVRPPSKRAGAYAYLGAAHSYLTKDPVDKSTGEVIPLELPFRCWGTSSVTRTVRELNDAIPLLGTKSGNRFAKCARTDTKLARKLCALATIQEEQRRHVKDR